ncbi:MAG: hypothetical protein HZB91_11305 [Elusimicrobia bacterium]|nr:hypothetical protein [Elusimicrobiota bacterium]
MKATKIPSIILSFAVLLSPVGGSAQTLQMQAARPSAVQAGVPMISVNPGLGNPAAGTLPSGMDVKATVTGLGIPSLQTFPALQVGAAEVSALPAGAPALPTLEMAAAQAAAPMAPAVAAPENIAPSAAAPAVEASAGQGTSSVGKNASRIKKLVNAFVSRIGFNQPSEASISGTALTGKLKPVLLPNGALPDAPPDVPVGAASGARDINTIHGVEVLDQSPAPGIFDQGPIVLQADPGSEAAIEAALRSLVDSQVAKYGVTSAELQTVHVKRVAGVGHQTDTIFAYFRQSKDGYVIRGSYLGFTVKVIKGKPVVLASTAKLFPNMVVDTTPIFSEPEMRDAAINYLGVNPQQMGLQMQAYGQQIIHIGSIWRAVQLYTVETLPFMIAVDVVTGTAFAWDARANADADAAASGKIEGRGVAEGPTKADTVPDVLPMADMDVTLSNGKKVQTDSKGGFSADATKSADTDPADPAKTGDVTFKATLSGRYVQVENQGGKTLTISGTLKPGTEASVVFNPTGASEEDIAQVNAYYHFTQLIEYAKAHGIDDKRLERAIRIRTNIDDECNAYYTPGWPSLNFFKSSSNCANTAFASVIRHEGGHFIDDMIGGIVNGGLSEGWGDIFSMFMSNNPIVGEGFLKNQEPNYVRHGENKHQYKEYDEVHDQGQVWMGFAWKLRKALIASLGREAGAAVAEAIILPTLFSKAADIPTAIAQVLLNDMDANGVMPHEAEIRAAAKEHGVDIPKSPGAAGLFTYASHVITDFLSPMSPAAGVEGATLKAKMTFTVGALMRGQVRRELEKFLDQRDGITYQLKEYKGWLSSDFLLVVEGPEAEVRRVTDAIQNWFQSLEGERMAFVPAGSQTNARAPEAIVPSWFDASGLSFAFVKKANDGLLMAILRRGRYELSVFLDEKGSGQAIFTKYSLNPMGTPKKEEIPLTTGASRRAVAEILRATQAAEPVSGAEKSVLDAILAMLDGSLAILEPR